MHPILGFVGGRLRVEGGLILDECGRECRVAHTGPVSGPCLVVLVENPRSQVLAACLGVIRPQGMVAEAKGKAI